MAVKVGLSDSQMWSMVQEDGVLLVLYVSMIWLLLPTLPSSITAYPTWIWSLIPSLHIIPVAIAAVRTILTIITIRTAIQLANNINTLITKQHTTWTQYFKNILQNKNKPQPNNASKQKQQEINQAQDKHKAATLAMKRAAQRDTLRNNYGDNNWATEQIGTPARDRFVIRGHVQSSLASTQKGLLHRENISDDASLQRFIKEIESEKKQESLKPVTSSADPDRYLYMRPIEASSGRKHLPLAMRNFTGYSAMPAKKSFNAKEVRLWDLNEKLLKWLGLEIRMDELAERTRENIANNVFGAYRQSLTSVKNFFLQAKNFEMQKPDVSQWKKDELKEARESLSHLYRYFQKYYGNSTDLAVQQHLKIFSTLEKMAVSIAGSHISAYCRSRILELASLPYLQGFSWNSGGTWKGRNWNPRLPTDSVLVMRLFCSYVTEVSSVDILEHHFVYHNDAVALFPEEHESYSATGYVGQFDAFVDEDAGFELPIKDVALIELSVEPDPYFAVLVEERVLALAEEKTPSQFGSRNADDADEFDGVGFRGARRVKINGGLWQLWHPQPGSENVFHAIAMFVYIIETRLDNQLMSFNPSRCGLQLS